tara:strand:- start:3147 stop:4415 length:1269 start_codon:yes stop_codon:yes gene_type:complete
MSKISVTVKNLSKMYRIGRKQGSDTLSDSIKTFFLKPFINFKEISSLSNFDTKHAKSSNTFWALKNVSFDLKVGDRVGIIGKNGSGKSTLLKCISRITNISEGEIEVNGSLASLLEVGTGFHPDLSGRDNIYLNGTILGLSKKQIDEKFSEIVEFSSVGDFIDTPVKRYSSGMLVRLAFSVAANLDPDIFLIDEVLAVGDINFQDKAIKKIKEQYSKDKIIFFVSHQLSLVEEICNKCILLDSGRIAAIGSTKDIISKYISSWKVKKKVDLKDIANRSGSQIVTIDRIDINSDYENIFCGGKFYVDVSYSSKKDIYDKRCFMYLSIKNRLFVKQFQLSTKLVDYNELNWDKEGILRFSIEELNLNNGIYHMDVLFRLDDTNSDFIEDAITFKVEKSDYFGTGSMPKEKHGNMLTKFRLESKK